MTIEVPRWCPVYGIVLMRDPFSVRAPVVLPCEHIISRLAAHQILQVEDGAGGARCPICQAPFTRSTLHPVSARAEALIADELTHLRSKYKGAALPTGAGPGGTFVLAMWMHQLGFVHRRHALVPRQLLTHLACSSAWTMRQKHHQPPQAPDLRAALAATAHLQHLPSALTREPAPDAWCSGFARLAPYVAQMPALRSLEIAYVALLDTTQRASAVLDEVVAAATQLESLALLRTGRVCAGSAGCLRRSLRGLVRLRSLELAGVDLCGVELGGVWALVAGLPQLTRLDLSDNDLAAGMETLPGDLWREEQAPQLRELFLQENQLSDAVCERLFSYFPAMPRLARLNLNNNLLGDDGTEALAAALQHAQHLTELDLSANAALDEAGALALAQHLQPGLERLDVSGSAVTEGAERALSQLPCWPDNQIIQVIIAVRASSHIEAASTQTRVGALTARMAFYREKHPEGINLYLHNRLLPGHLTLREAGVQHNTRLTMAPVVPDTTAGDSSSSDHDVTT